ATTELRTRPTEACRSGGSQKPTFARLGSCSIFDFFDSIGPMLTWARHALCGAAIRGAGTLNPFSQGWPREGVVVHVPRFFAQGNSQDSYTVDFDIKWPRPRRDMNKDPGWGLNEKVSRIDFVKLREICVVRSAVDVALDHAVQRRPG